MVVHSSPAPFPLDEVVAALRDGARAVDLLGCEGAFKAYVLTLLARRVDRPLICVTRSAREAERLEADLLFFHGRGADAAAEVRPASEVALLPGPDASPYGALSPERRIVMARLAVLSRLAFRGPGPPVRHLVLPAAALHRRVVPRRSLTALAEIVVRGENLDRDALTERLTACGYLRVPTVEEPGTFALRGGVLDVFSPLHPAPVRMELWDETVETLRFFDPGTQRTGEEVEALYVAPVREEVLTVETLARARERLVALADTLSVPSSRLRNVLADIGSGLRFLGIEGFLPAFFDLEDPWLHFPEDAVVVLDDPDAIEDELRSLDERARAEYAARTASGELVFPPEAHFARVEGAIQFLESRVRLRTGGFSLSGSWPRGAASVTFCARGHEELAARVRSLQGDEAAFRPVADEVHSILREGYRVAIAAGTPGRCERIREILRQSGFRVETAGPYELLGPGRDNLTEGKLSLVEGHLSSGFTVELHGLALLSDAELLGEKVRRRRRSTPSADPFLSGFLDLSPGDLVVHVDHGIGRYAGLVKMAVGGIENDFVVVEYQGSDRLYLPVQRLGGIQKYLGGDPAGVRLDRLGGTAWERTKRKVKENVRELAESLLRLYASRQAARRPGVAEPDEYFREFEASFPFEETPDQEKAIADVLEDMVGERPMDRLILGDVGYGKTEVAMRAAFLAALSARQTAVLVPTTVLAQQHFHTFRERFAGYPVRVEVLSRSVPAARQKEILRDVAAGKVDILIGTHRLLSRDVSFRNLGLLVVDEEHRFGVRAKERLKELRGEVDVLTLTATPIPRTLNMAMSGLRDLSILATPPVDRQSVRTLVVRWDDGLIREAVLQELRRGGQVFFVHNRIHSLGEVHERLRTLVPEARIGVAHGRMDPAALERVMLDFVEGRIHVLLSTAIIQSGLDIPRANTLIVDQAHQFGLAELYQLRGRVGRSRERAFAYLVVPERSALSDEARARLDVLQRFTELGAGFQIAAHDLEIRGAGELLGASQSGHVAAVGLDLYTELLEEAVEELRCQPVRRGVEPELKVEVPAFLPEDYVADVGQRLVLYKRLSLAATEGEVWEMHAEIVDRYGRPPETVTNLAEVMCLKALARQAGIEKVEVDGTGNRLVLHLGPEPLLTPDAVMGLLQSPTRRWRLTPDMKLWASLGSGADGGSSLASARAALRELVARMDNPPPEPHP